MNIQFKINIGRCRTLVAATLGPATLFLSMGLAFGAAPVNDEDELIDEAPLVDYYRWLTEDRVGPQKGQGSLLEAWSEIKKMPNATGAGGAIWQLLGPAPLISGSTILGGRTPSIAIDPADPSTLFIGAALGGVWKSTDAGATWTPLTDDQPSLAMGWVAVDPTDSNIVYAGTGEQDNSGDSYYGAGVLRSMDGGATWDSLGEEAFVRPNGGSAKISRVVIDPNSPEVVYVASNLGLYKSSDRGETWELKLSGKTPDNAAVTELVMDPTDSTILYAGVAVPSTAMNKGIYKSTDAGENWTLLDIGLPQESISRINMGISRSNPLILYAAVNNASMSGNIWRLKTTDGGETWTSLPSCAGSGCGQGNYNLAVAVDPENPDIVYQAAVNMFRSFNGGQTWTNRSGGHVDFHSLVFDDFGHLYITNDGGIFVLDTSSDTLSSLNGGVAITQLYAGVAQHPTDGGIVQAGSQDNGSQRTTGDPLWHVVCGGDGAYQAIEGVDGDPDRVWYCSSQYLGIRKTINNGQSFTNATTGILDLSTATFVAPYRMDPNNSQTLLAGTRTLWRTENGAATWVANSPTFSTSIRSIAFAPSASSTNYYAGTTSGEIWRTTNTGDSWMRVDSDLPSRVVTHIAVHPKDANIVYATFSGFATGHVFRSTDAGDTWDDISGDLPNLPTQALLIDDSTETPTLYVGTDLGVFRSLDDGNSWERFSAGLPNVRVEDLVLNPNTGVLVAATHGRGAWQLVVQQGK